MNNSELTSSFSAEAQNKDYPFKDILCLTKPRVSALIVFSAAAGMSVAPCPKNFILVFSCLLSIMLGSSAAAVFNMWYDRDIDLIMARTASRPIPAGRVSPDFALEMSFLLFLLSISLIFLSSNLLATILLVSSILFYAGGYTVLLKRNTVHNVVIGGISGALAPLIGYASFTSSISIMAILIAFVIFAWTPAHFWALAIVMCSDYKKIGVPMMPVVDGIRKTKLFILIYSILTSLFAISTCFLDPYNSYFLYVLLTCFISLWFCIKAFLLFKSSDIEASCYSQCLSFFKISIVYLFIWLSAVIITALISYW